MTGTNRLQASYKDERIVFSPAVERLVFSPVDERLVFSPVGAGLPANLGVKECPMTGTNYGSTQLNSPGRWSNSRG